MGEKYEVTSTLPTRVSAEKYHVKPWMKSERKETFMLGVTGLRALSGEPAARNEFSTIIETSKVYAKGKKS